MDADKHLNKNIKQVGNKYGWKSCKHVIISCRTVSGSKMQNVCILPVLLFKNKHPYFVHFSAITFFNGFDSILLFTLFSFFKSILNIEPEYWVGEMEQSTRKS